MQITSPAQQLVVAADFRPDPSKGQGRQWVRDEVVRLADDLGGTGVILKVNSALRACGYPILNRIRERGLGTFADLKLNDIPETMETDGILLAEARPDMVTVMCSAGVVGMRALASALPETEVLGVTVLTSLAGESQLIFGGGAIIDTVMCFAGMGYAGLVDGLVSAGTEVDEIINTFGLAFTLNTPAIRPLWYQVQNDDQNRSRTMTPRRAISLGASRIVVGRPILQAKNRRDAVMRTIDEIANPDSDG